MRCLLPSPFVVRRRWCACRKEFCSIRHSFRVRLPLRLESPCRRRRRRRRRLAAEMVMAHIYMHTLCVPGVLYFPVRFSGKLRTRISYLCPPASSAFMSPSACIPSVIRHSKPVVKSGRVAETNTPYLCLFECFFCCGSMR